MQQPEIKVLPDLDAIAIEAAERIIHAADEEIALKGEFSIALSGGSTPARLYSLLATDAYVSRIDWANVRVYFGDERCVPPDDARSNFRVADQALLSHVPIPPQNIFRMKGELEAEEAAKEYGLMLKAKFGDGGLDFALLGMGDDGHTASIFPHTPAVQEKEHRVLGYFAERSSTGPSWRITMTAPFLNRSRRVLILVAGASKTRAMQEVLEGPRDPDRLPIQLIQPASGRLSWLVDVQAAGMAE